MGPGVRPRTTYRKMKKILVLLAAAATLALPNLTQAQSPYPAKTYLLLSSAVFTNGYQYVITDLLATTNVAGYSAVPTGYANTLYGPVSGYNTNVYSPVWLGRGLAIWQTFTALSNNTSPCGFTMRFDTSPDMTNWTVVSPITNTVTATGTYPTNMSGTFYGGNTTNYTTYTLIPNTTLDNANFIRISGLTNACTNSIRLTTTISIFP